MYEYIKNEKIKLAVDILIKKVLTFLVTSLSVGLIYFIVWDRCNTSGDILYLALIYLCTGTIITLLIYFIIDEAIESYKDSKVRSIYIKAKKKFMYMEV